MTFERSEVIRPLLESQPYVTGVYHDDSPADATYDMSLFRRCGWQRDNLAQWQARHVGIQNLDLSPWLAVPRIENGLVVMARSFRYQNWQFPWAELVHRYRARAVFVGHPQEHIDFQKKNSCQLRYLPTKDLLELAYVIAGADFFIGNQSCPFWIAAGIGVPIIQESWEQGLNSVIDRPNILYTNNGPETRTLRYKLDDWEKSIT